MELTKEQVAGYHRDGFLVVEGLASDAEVATLRGDALKLCRGEYPGETLKPVPPGTTDDDALRQYLCIHMVHHVSDTMLEAGVKHSGIAHVLSRIIAPNVKCMQSMLFIKPPGFPGQAWHQDEIYIPTRDRSLTGAWIALDDATVDNGCLWVLPGSHTAGYLYPQHDHNRPDQFDFAKESYGFDDRDEIPVECPAGSVVFFNGYLLHRSRKNRSDRFRRVLVNHYMNAASLLPWHPPAEGQSMATADYRGIVMVAGEDPYAWKGTLPPRKDVHVRTFDRDAAGVP